MEKDDLRLLAQNALAHPFRIKMNGGESFEVLHHDFITVSDYHAAIVVPDEDGAERVRLASLLNISSIEMLPEPAEQGPRSSNGKKP